MLYNYSFSIYRFFQKGWRYIQKVTPRSEKLGRATKQVSQIQFFIPLIKVLWVWESCVTVHREEKKDQENSKDLLKVQTVTLTSVLARQTQLINCNVVKL